MMFRGVIRISNCKRLYSTFDSKKVLNSLKNPELFRTQAYVNGEWMNSKDQEKFEVKNPALSGDGAKIADVSSMTEDDYEYAINCAHDAFQHFKTTTGRHRAELLSNLNKLIKDNEEDLAKLIVLENGKPFTDALGEIRYANSFFQWFSEEAPRITGDVISSANPSSRIMTLKQPIGVVGILTPWNFPQAMITRKLGASIAAGCTSVIKPASETPISALALAHLCHEAGVAPGVVNVLPSANSAAVGELLCEHPLISKISFTGSTNVGKLLMEQSSSTLKKLSMELGGNAPFIAFEDADVDKAVDGAIASKFRSSGQTCVCANRIFVHENIYDDFASKLVERLKAKTVLGNGLDEHVTHGPLIHDRSMNKVRSHIEDAVSKGASVLLGGNQRPDLGENFHELTVLGDVTKDMIIFQDETFGPVAPLIKFGGDSEVIKLANDTDVGLAGYFFSKNITKIFKVAENLNVGMMGVNTGLISEAAVPFGGVAQSGFGREGSKYGVDDYLIIKSVVLGGIN